MGMCTIHVRYPHHEFCALGDDTTNFTQTHILPTSCDTRTRSRTISQWLIFPHGNQILDMYCARARPPGSQDSGTMHCPSLGETAMSHIYACLGNAYLHGLEEPRCWEV